MSPFTTIWRHVAGVIPWEITWYPSLSNVTFPYPSTQETHSLVFTLKVHSYMFIRGIRVRVNTEQVCLLCAKHCAKSCPWIISFTPSHNPLSHEQGCLLFTAFLTAKDRETIYMSTKVELVKFLYMPTMEDAAIKMNEADLCRRRYRTISETLYCNWKESKV